MKNECFTVIDIPYKWVEDLKRNNIMTPKEKAKDIFNKYYELGTSANNILNINRAKNYALIVVDEIINCDSFFQTFDEVKSFAKYWEEVRNEINKL